MQQTNLNFFKNTDCKKVVEDIFTKTNESKVSESIDLAITFIEDFYYFQKDFNLDKSSVCAESTDDGKDTCTGGKYKYVRKSLCILLQIS